MDTKKGRYGKDGFDELLGSLLTIQPAIHNVRAVIVVMDSDDDPAQAFQFAQRKIREAGSYGVPVAPLAFKQSPIGIPATMVMTIPWTTEPGNLETLVAKAVPHYFAQEWQCLEVFYHCTSAPRWRVGQQSKMQMACAIAAVWQDDPSCAMSNMWSKSIFKPLLQHSCFDQIANFLQDIASQYTQPLRNQI
jgi:hypothetical protein